MILSLFATKIIQEYHWVFSSVASCLFKKSHSYTNSSPLKLGRPKRKFHLATIDFQGFQPLVFREEKTPLKFCLEIQKKNISFCLKVQKKLRSKNFRCFFSPFGSFRWIFFRSLKNPQFSVESSHPWIPSWYVKFTTK